MTKEHPNNRLCPECGAQRAADNTPSCGCGERVSEALRDARTAEAAAAEDFDPLRIRPYVELESDSAAETMRLRPIRQPEPTPPTAQDLSLFEGDTTSHDDAAEAGPATPARPTRHRRTVLLGAGGALVAVIAAAGLASGMFTYDAPARKTALPDDVRVSVPAPPTSSEAPEPATPTPTTPSESPSPTRSPSPSSSPTPTATRSTASPTPTATTEPTTPSSPTEESDSQSESAAARQPTPPTLQRGDRGAEVTELELRLTQLGLYTREARGNYNEGVEDAVARYQWARGIQREEYGVYDLETREKLESETTEP